MEFNEVNAIRKKIRNWPLNQKRNHFSATLEVLITIADRGNLEAHEARGACYDCSTVS